MFYFKASAKQVMGGLALALPLAVQAQTVEQNPLPLGQSVIIDPLPRGATPAMVNDASRRRIGDYINDRGETCRFKDRFDRSSVLSYALNDSGSLRLSLQYKSLADGGDRPSSPRIMLTWSSGGERTRQDNCRVHSPVQGLLGSLWNESVYRHGENSLSSSLRSAGLRLGF